MSAMAEKARERAKSKVTRLTTADPRAKVDASSWTPPEAMDADVQTGLRPISRRQFKRGGKVAGEKAAMHAGRKPRKSGGALTAESLINRNVKEANEERSGTKHVGGMKRGGRAHRDMGGGLALPAWSDAVTRKSGGRTGKMVGGGMCGGAPVSARPMPGGPGARPMMRAAGGKVHAEGCKCEKCSGGRVGKKAGGALDGALQGMRPEGARLARKGGGRAKKGMNVNIIIAPGNGGQTPAPPMPPVGAGPVGLHQAPPPGMPPAGLAAPMGPAAAMPPPQMRKSGGRTGYPIESGAGGGLGRLEKARAYG